MTVSGTGFFIVMASLLIGSTAVSDSGYRCDCQCSSQYQGEDFHDALPVVIEKLQIPATPDDSAEDVVLVELAPRKDAVRVFITFIVVAADNPVAYSRLN